MFKNSIQSLTIIGFSLALAACGGGGDGVTATPAPAISPTPTANPGATPTPTADPDASPTPTADPSASPTPTADPGTSPTPTADPGTSPTPTVDPGTSPTPTADPIASPTPTTDPVNSPTPTPTAESPPTPTPEPQPQGIVGSWQLAPEAGSLGVGPAAGDTGWWSIPEEGITQRDCLYDDVYNFAENGDYTLDLQSETWLEPFQGVPGEQCGAPVSPHDGSGTYSYTFDESANSLTIQGTGGFIGLAKIVNGEELTSPGDAPASITFDVVSLDEGYMVLQIDSGDSWWQLRLARQGYVPPTPEPTPLVPFDAARNGNLDGVQVWQLPDAPNGDEPVECWLAVGSDIDGDVYISGHDHVNNSMLYRLPNGGDYVSWVGDAETASLAVDNWEPGETAEKFHTRPTHLDGDVYVATLDYSSIDSGYLDRRGFHWYAYNKEADVFSDLSVFEENGVGADLQIVGIAADPFNERIYGMSVGDPQLVSYDINAQTTTVLGRPADWEPSDFFYSNRFMWVDSFGTVYITGGSSRGQWNRGEDPDVFDNVYTYNPSTGFGIASQFFLQGPNAMEIGQWDRRRETLYTADDQGNIYRFEDATGIFTFLGRPNFDSGFKTWIFQLSADEEKIYIGRSDGAVNDNAIWEFDIASGDSYQIASLGELDSAAGQRSFITGYDSWDGVGNFYFSAFDWTNFSGSGDNVHMIGFNPVRVKYAQSLISELIEVDATAVGNSVQVSRSGGTSGALEVLYEVRGYNASGQRVETTYGEVDVPSGQASVSLSVSSIDQPSGGDVVSTVFRLVDDGNDYIVGDGREVNL